jgi:spore cortex formation protein SpoVR/YcgB (stage V sporulation)
MIKTMKYVRELWGYPVQMIEQLRDPDTGEVIETDLLFALD